jgi:hypothetical protein
MEKIKIYIGATIVILAVLAWSEVRGAQVMIAAGKYEECVQVEYGTTPMEYYWDQGEYPECEK